MSKVNSRRRLVSSVSRGTNRRKAVVVLAGAVASAFGSGGPVWAGNYYWDGATTSVNWGNTAGGTNWSGSNTTISDPGTTPGFGGAGVDNVFFTFPGAGSTASATMVDTSLNINSLTFTIDASSPVGIGGSNILTIGTGGLTVVTGSGGAVTTGGGPTLSTNVAIGAAETWANNATSTPTPTPSGTIPGNTLTVSGILSGSAALSLQGTGSALTPSGSFNFSGANAYSGTLTLVNANTSLTVSGGGTLTAAAGITLGGGTFLTLDDTGTNTPNRLGSVPLSSNGGTISLLGSSAAASSDGFGALNLLTGVTNVNVTPGSGQTATLTIGSLSRLAGAAVNFSSTGTIGLTTPGSLPNGIIGPWATIGDLTNGTSGNGALDFATVSGGTVVAYSGYDTNASHLTTAGTGFSTANIKLTSGGPSVLAGSVTVNTLYMSGTAGVEINAAQTNTQVLTIGAGGIIANGGTASYNLAATQALITNATWIGGPGFSVQGPAASDNQAGTITVPAGVPDLVINVPGSYNPTSGLINGALQLNVKNISNTTSPLGTATAATTTGSTTVTLTSGSTAGLYPGAAVTGLSGTGIVGTTQYIVNILNSTQFTIGNAPTAAAGSATATFVGNTGLTKNGGGLLDLADGNELNKTEAYTFAGPVTVNGGVVLIGADLNLGAAPLSFNPAAIVLNGGEIRSTAGLTFAATRGFTVGPQGGTISYTGGGTLTLTAKVTGAGGVTFDGDSYNGGVTFNLSNTAPDTYQGPTIFELKGNTTTNSTMNLAQANVLPSGTALSLALAPAFQSGSGGAATAVTQFGNLNLSASALTIGSLASPVGLTHANLAGTVTTTLTIGGTAASPVSQSATFNGVISGTLLSVVKNGGGTETFAGANTYTGTTTINGGILSVTNTTGSGTGTGAVTVASGGTLSGTGMITGAVTVNAGGALAPAGAPAGASTLQLKGGLTLNGGTALNGGSLLNFNLGAINTGTNPIASPTSDNVFVTGNLAMTAGTDTININALPGFTTGTYHLITNTGTNPSLTGINFVVNGPGADLYTVTDNAGGDDSLDLNVTTNPNPPLTWVGNPGSGTWNTNTTPTVWKFTGGTGLTSYVDGTNVTFDNTPGGSSASPLNIAISISPNSVAPGSMTFNNNIFNSYTFSGSAITGSTGLTMTGTGTVTFNNTNTFSGPANVNSGTLVVGPTGALADAAFTIAASGALTVNGALSAAPAISNAGTLTVNSTATIPAASTLSNSGTATFNNAAQTLAGVSGTGSLVLNGTALTSTGTSEYDGVISNGTNPGSLTVSGGALALTNANTYGNATTTTTVSGGKLVVANTTGSATGLGAVAVNSGGVLGGSGSIAGPVTVSATGAGTIQPGLGAGGVATGTPTTLTINNNFTLNGGSVLAYQLGAAPSSDLVQVNGNLTLNAGTDVLNISSIGAGVTGGTYELIGFTGSLTNNNPTFTINGLPAGVSQQVLTPSQPGGVANEVVLTVAIPSLIKWTGAAGTSGAGAWDTTSVNWAVPGTPTPTPTSFINAIPVIFDNSGAFPGVATTVTVVAGGVTPGNMTFNNGGAVGTATPYTFTGGPINGSGSLTLSATAGQVTLAAANGYTGGTAINGGQLSLTSTAGTSAGSGTIAVNAGGLLSVGTTGAVTIANPITLASGISSPSGIGVVPTSTGAITLSGTLTATTGTTSIIQDFDPVSATTPNQDILLTGVLAGGGTIIVPAVPGDPRDNTGVRFRNLGSTFTGTIDVQNSTKFELQWSATSTNSPIGTGNIVFQAGTQTGTANGGTFPVINIRNSSGSAGNTTFGNNLQAAGTGFVFFNQLGGAAGSTTTFGNLKVGGSGITQTIFTGATAVALQTMIFPTVTTEGGSVTFEAGMPGNTDYVDPDNFTLGPIAEDSTVSPTPSTSLTFNSDPPTTTPTATPGGTVTLTGTNTYGGSTTLLSGTLILGAAGALPTTTALTVNGGTMDFNNAGTSNNQTVASLAGTGGIITNSDTVNTRTFTVNQTTNTTYSGAITGNLNFTKSGAGTLILAGASTYSGVTTISGGAILAGNGTNGSATGTNTVTVQSGGTLGGGPAGGSIAGPATVNSGATLRGNSTGVFALTGAVTLAANSNLQFVLNANNTTATTPMISVGGTIGATAAGTLGVTSPVAVNLVNGGAAATPGYYYLLGYGTNPDPSANLTENIPTGWVASYIDDVANESIDLSVTSVPEPVSIGVIAIAGLGLLARRRRRARG